MLLELIFVFNGIVVPRCDLFYNVPVWGNRKLKADKYERYTTITYRKRGN